MDTHVFGQSFARDRQMASKTNGSINGRNQHNSERTRLERMLSIETIVLLQST